MVQIKDVLSTHQRITIIMTDANDQTHHIRSSGVPEAEHKEIYRLLEMVMGKTSVLMLFSGKNSLVGIGFFLVFWLIGWTVGGAWAE